MALDAMTPAESACPTCDEFEDKLFDVRRENAKLRHGIEEALMYLGSESIAREPLERALQIDDEA